jgi:hypothetical protein
MEMKVSILTTALMISLLAPMACRAYTKPTSFVKGEKLIVNVYNRDSQKDSAMRAEFLSFDEFNSEVTVKIQDSTQYLNQAVMELPADRIFRLKGCVGGKNEFGLSEKVCVGDRITLDYQIQSVLGTNLKSGTLALSRPTTQKSPEKLYAGVHHQGGIGFMRGCAEGFCVGDKIGIKHTTGTPVAGTELAEVVSIVRIGYGGIIYYKSARGLDRINPHWIDRLDFIEYAPGFSADSVERGELHKRLQ